MAGTSDYTLDTGILEILDCYTTSNSQNYPLQRVTLSEIIRMRQASPSSSSPIRYYAVQGGNLFAAYPTPTASGTVTVYYVPRPATLSSGSDTPSEIPTEFHKLVEWYALAEAADFDDDGSSGVGQGYLARYEKGIREARKALTLKGGTRLAPNIPGRRRRLVKSVPSQDLY